MLKIIVITAMISLSVIGKLHANTLIIAHDLSASNPLLVNENFKRASLAYLATQMNELSRGDSVILKTFGDIANPQNFNSYEIKLGRSQQKSLSQIHNYIATIHKRFKPQGSTNIIAWLGRNEFNCAQESQHIVVVTDGIEASEYADPLKLMAGETQLPKPNEFVNLSGCTITFYGLGVGRADKEALHLRRAWHRYFEQARANFNVVIL